MINSRVLEVLETLPKDKLTQLDLFLRSPYHNNAYDAEAILDLFTCLQQAIAEKDEAKLSKQYLNKRYFPEHEYVEKKKNPIDTLASHLFKKIREFLHLEYLQHEYSSAPYYLSLARYYRENSLEERFWQVIKQFRKHLSQDGKEGPQYYYDSFLLEEEVVTFRSIFNTYTDDANLITAHQYLDQFFCTKKFELASVLLLQKQLGEVDERESLRLSELLEEAFYNLVSIQTPLAVRYKVVMELLRGQKSPEEGLEEFRRLLELDKVRIAQEKYRNLMAFYRYFLAMQYRQEVGGLEKLFHTYKEHLEEGYFLVEDKLLPTSLKNLVNLSIKHGDIDWAKKVVQDYPPDRITGTRYPQEAHSLCVAEVLFANEEYEEATDNLSYQNFENVNHSILADILLIKIYYTTENELIHPRIRALEQKVRRSKLTKEVKTSYLNFLRFLNQVKKYEHDKTHKKWLQLAEKLKTMVPMIEREWLREIIS